MAAWCSRGTVVVVAALALPSMAVPATAQPDLVVEPIGLTDGLVHLHPSVQTVTATPDDQAIRLTLTNGTAHPVHAPLTVHAVFDVMADELVLGPPLSDAAAERPSWSGPSAVTLAAGEQATITISLRAAGTSLLVLRGLPTGSEHPLDALILVREEDAKSPTLELDREPGAVIVRNAGDVWTIAAVRVRARSWTGVVASDVVHHVVAVPPGAGRQIQVAASSRVPGPVLVDALVETTDGPAVSAQWRVWPGGRDVVLIAAIVLLIVAALMVRRAYTGRPVGSHETDGG